MKQVLTIVNTEEMRLGTRLGIEQLLERHAIEIHEIRQFDLAVDIEYSGDLPANVVAAWADARRVDFALQPLAGRLKKLFVSDMESTLVRNEFLDDLAALCGVGPAVKAITARAMNGEIDFAGSLTERVALLAGQPAGLLERAYEDLRWMPGALELFQTLRLHGVRTIIVSGGFTFFTSRVREILGADADFANDLEVENGQLTGRPRLPISGGDQKKEILLATAQSMGISPLETAAIGDGANDLPMLLSAGLGIAFHGKPAVLAAANFRIIHSDLRAVLYMMGLVSPT